MPNKKDSYSQETTFRESPWYIMNFMRRIDRFGEPIPAFNIKGRNKVTTTIGGFMTLMVMFLTLSYLTSKINSIVQKKNPIMNENKI